MTTLETVPTTWDPDRDEQFFRITARLLPAAFTSAASSLLASYDDEPTPSRTGVRPLAAASGADRAVPATRVAR